MWSTPAVWKQYNKMAVLHFFLVNSSLYILFSMSTLHTSVQHFCMLPLATLHTSALDIHMLPWVLTAKLWHSCPQNRLTTDQTWKSTNKKLTNKSFNQSTNQSINQSINMLSNQIIKKLFNHNWSIKTEKYAFDKNDNNCWTVL